MRRQGLRSRVARLTPEQKRNFVPVKLCFTRFDAPESEIQGYGDFSGATVQREPFESLATLTARAFSQLGVASIFAVYPVGIEDEPAPTPVAPPPAPIVDPYALSGIGKTDPRYADYSREQWG